MGAALLAMTGLASCVGDLDQMPKDPNRSEEHTSELQSQR